MACASMRASGRTHRCCRSGPVRSGFEMRSLISATAFPGNGGGGHFERNRATAFSHFDRNTRAQRVMPRKKRAINSAICAIHHTRAGSGGGGGGCACSHTRHAVAEVSATPPTPPFAFLGQVKWPHARASACAFGLAAVVRRQGRPPPPPPPCLLPRLRARLSRTFQTKQQGIRIRFEPSCRRRCRRRRHCLNK